MNTVSSQPTTATRAGATGSGSASRGGAGLALLGVILVALNLRTAVVSLSPIFSRLGSSFAVSSTAQGIMGMLPLLSFAVFGTLAPRLTRRFGLEKSLVIALALIVIGELVRAVLSHSMVFFGVFSMIALGGMGICNVLLPPAIKQYFPTKIGALTSMYLVLVAISASVPALVAVPLADTFGWRTAVGSWSALALIAILPWLGLANAAPPINAANTAAKLPAAWRWPTTWALMVLFSVGALSMYALIAWLPTLLTTSAGVTAATAGLMLSVYNLIGFPHSLAVPLILAKTKHPYVVVVFATVCLCSGVLGLGYMPQWAWFWIFPAGLGAMFIPIGLTLINLRSKTQAGTTALSGFVQGAGYLVAAIGPFLFGSLHTYSGSWLLPCWFLAGAGIVAALAGVIAVRPGYIEDSKVQ